jgi:hypothetical protein
MLVWFGLVDTWRMLFKLVECFVEVEVGSVGKKVVGKRERGEKRKQKRGLYRGLYSLSLWQWGLTIFTHVSESLGNSHWTNSREETQHGKRKGRDVASEI